MNKKFEFLDPKDYDEKDLHNFVQLYFQYLKALKAPQEDLFDFDNVTVDKNFLEQTISPENVAVQDFWHTIFGYVPNKFGDMQNSPLKVYLNKYDYDELVENYSMKNLDYSFVTFRDVINEMDEKQKLIFYDSSQKDFFDLSWLKRVRLFVREKNRNQIFGHNIHEQNIKLAKIMIPKLLIGEYKDWSEGTQNVDCQTIKDNETLLDRFDIENPQSDIDFERIRIKSKEFNFELKNFVKKLCYNRDYWLQFYKPKIAIKLIRSQPRQIASLPIRYRRRY